MEKEECVQVFNPQSKQMPRGKKISISESHIQKLGIYLFDSLQKKEKNRNLKEGI